MTLHRRELITGMIALIAAPAIVRAGSLMPVKQMMIEEFPWWGRFKVQLQWTLEGQPTIRLIRDGYDEQGQWYKIPCTSAERIAHEFRLRLDASDPWTLWRET